MKDVTIIDDAKSPQTTDMGLSVDQMARQVEKIQNLMKLLMREDEHYGIIPGTKKRTLYKSGAEKLGFVFRMTPSFKIERHDLPGDHREYEVICLLRHLETEKQVGEGIGSCSTMESKYRYRYDNEEESTQKPVPIEYWDIRKTDPNKAQEILGGKGYKPKKEDNGAWIIYKTKSKNKIENPDIADVFNTVLKMAKKRAYVDAMITACAASDIFTQDLEDLAVNRAAANQSEPTEETKEKYKAILHEIKTAIDETAIDEETAAMFKRLMNMIVFSENQEDLDIVYEVFKKITGQPDHKEDKKIDKEPPVEGIQTASEIQGTATEGGELDIF